jgi:hypothetical protein
MNNRGLAQLLPPSTQRQRIRIAFSRPMRGHLSLERRILVTQDLKFKTADWIPKRIVSKYVLRVDFSERGRNETHKPLDFLSTGQAYSPSRLRNNTWSKGYRAAYNYFSSQRMTQLIGEVIRKIPEVSLRAVHSQPRFDVTFAIG